MTILCVSLWAPQPSAPQPPAPPGTHTCIFCTVTFLLGLYTIMTWDFFLFQRRDIKLQIEIDTKVNVLGIMEVLKNCQTHLKKKVNHETTPPYLRDQFTTCDHYSFIVGQLDHEKGSI